MIGRTIQRWLLTLVLSFLEHFSLKAIKIFLKSFHLFLALSAFFLLGWTKPGGFIYWEDEVKWAKTRDWIHLFEFKENFSLWMLTPKIDQQNSLSKSAMKRLELQTLNGLCYYYVLRKKIKKTPSLALFFSADFRLSRFEVLNIFLWWSGDIWEPGVVWVWWGGSWYLENHNLQISLDWTVTTDWSQTRSSLLIYPRLLSPLCSVRTRQFTKLYCSDLETNPRSEGGQEIKMASDCYFIVKSEY